MSSSSRFRRHYSYIRLRHHQQGRGCVDDDDDDAAAATDDHRNNKMAAAFRGLRSLYAARLRRVHNKGRRRRLRRIIKIPRLAAAAVRKKARMLMAACAKTAAAGNRFKESKSHFGDLFAGNYLFFQVNPTPFKPHHLHPPPLTNY